MKAEYMLYKANCAVECKYVNANVNMQICVVKDEYDSRERRARRERRICAMHGEFVYRERQVFAIKSCLLSYEADMCLP